MLTPEEKEQIKKLLMKRTPVFRIAIDTVHSPNTIRKVRAELHQEIIQSQKGPQTDDLADFTIIPLEVGFLAELMVEKIIDPSNEVFVPVPREVAHEFFKIEEAFQKLEPLLNEMVEAIKEGIEYERTEAGSEERDQ
ncbi:hypothetical protein ES703_06517 [subsurface metagenome]